MKQPTSGFTLIELMIVVAIISLLAAIAIPNFMQYQLKTKKSEAVANLSGIARGQESYRAEFDGYLSIAPTPANGTPQKVSWTIIAALAPGIGGGVGSFEDIGFRPSGDVYYTYASAISADSTGTNNQNFTADATADLDGSAAAPAYAAATHGAFGISNYDALINIAQAAQTGVAGTTNISTTMAVLDINPGQF